MHSTEFLLVQFVVNASNEDDKDLCVTIDYDTAIAILRNAQMTTELDCDIEDFDDD